MDNTPSGNGPQAAAFGESDKKRIIFGSLLLVFPAALDQTIVAPAMPVIAAALGHADYLPWVVTAYLLTATAVAPLYGKLSDTYGRRPVVFLALSIFMLGSIACALAPGMLALVLARALQGVGGGGMMTLAQTMIGDLVPPRERARYAAWFSGMWAVASLSGPILGGVFAEHFHWSLIFWINIPIVLLGLPVIWKPLKRLAVRGDRHRLDVVGAVLLVAATSLLMLTLTWGGTRYPWLSLPILLLFGVSALFWIVFARHLLRTDEPLISLVVLRDRIIRGIAITMFLTQGAVIGLTVYLPIYLQSYQGLSAGESGVALLGLLLSSTAGSFTSSRLTLKIKRHQRISLFGLLFAVLCLVLLTAVASTRDLLLFQIICIGIGFGTGTMYPIAMVTLQAAAGRANLGVANGLLAFMRALGSACGVALLGAIALGLGIPLASEGHSGAIPDLPYGPFAMLFAAAAGTMMLALLAWWLTPQKNIGDLPGARPPAA
ncbi:MAG: MDR family MFS transporter [Rhizobiaceae bacterium]